MEEKEILALKESETKYGREIGYKNSTVKYIWGTCSQCGYTRWIALTKYTTKDFRCQTCARKAYSGEKSHLWKGGETYTKQGYRSTTLFPESPFYSMGDKIHHKVLEHRLVMAKYMGRCLQSWEIVHHKNHIRTDNRIENLELFTDNEHKSITLLESRVEKLEKRITLLEAENSLLRTQMETVYDNC